MRPVRPVTEKAGEASPSPTENIFPICCAPPQSVIYLSQKGGGDMTAKERMIKALTDMLKSGETLMYPIYGLLVQGEKNIMDISDLRKTSF